MPFIVLCDPLFVLYVRTCIYSYYVYKETELTDGAMIMYSYIMSVILHFIQADTNCVSNV